jgi:hydroxymethylglutaryl-CoA lyase
MYPKKAMITEVGTRDGFQYEKTFIPTAQKIEVINALTTAGVRRLEATSFVSPRAVPQMADAAEVMAGITRAPDLRVACIVPNHQGAARALAAKADELVLICSASESHNRANLNRSTADSLAGFPTIVDVGAKHNIAVNAALAVVFGCPFEGDVDPEHVAGIIAQLRDMGIKAVTLGDTTGMATPPIVDRVVKLLQDRFPDVSFSLHFHNTRGIGLVNVMAGLACGIDKYESSFAGLGGCPFAPGASGNICTEDLVYMLHECGVDTGIDLPKLLDVARLVERIIGRELPGQVMKAGPRTKRFAVEGAARAVG